MSQVLIEKNGGLLVLTLNRPEKKNAITLAMYETLANALSDGEKDDQVRVYVLRGTNGIFTAGNDLMDFMGAPPASEDSPVFRFLMALTEITKPLIVAVEGPAIGIGTTLLLHADLVYAADSTRFALPFVNLALVPEGASSFLLPRLAGHAKASELLLFGEPFSAATGKEVGLVNEVLPTEALHARVMERATALAQRPNGALRESKQLIKAGVREPVRAALVREATVFMARLATEEAQEAFQAFFNKKKS